jgi:RNA recognition motif-containing protein
LPSDHGASSVHSLGRIRRRFPGKAVSASLYVSNLPPSFTEEMLTATFGRFGTVLSVRLKRDSPPGLKSRRGFVEMKTSDEARLAAQALNGTRFDSRLVSVSRAARS